MLCEVNFEYGYAATPVVTSRLSAFYALLFVFGVKVKLQGKFPGGGKTAVWNLTFIVFNLEIKDKNFNSYPHRIIS